jgi:hypothetical protein
LILEIPVIIEIERENRENRKIRRGKREKYLSE